MAKGMFDLGPTLQETVAEAQVPEFLLHKRRAENAARGLAETTAPWLKETFGYESPERKMKSLAANTDLSDGKAVQNTFNKLMSINPEAAKQWLTSVKPIIEQHMEQQKASTPTMTTRQKDIRDIAQLNLGCDINSKNILASGRTCYQEASLKWVEGKRLSAAGEGAKATAKEESKIWSAEAGDTVVRSKEAISKLARVNQSLGILDTGNLYTGTGANLVNFAHNIGAMFGVDASQVKAANAKQFISNRLSTAMDWISRTKGAISNTEMKLFLDAAEGLTATEGGNRMILNTIKATAEYERRYANEQARWRLQDEADHKKSSPNTPYVPNIYKWQLHLSKWNQETNSQTGEENGLRFPSYEEIQAAIGKQGTDKQSTGKKVGAYTIKKIK